MGHLGVSNGAPSTVLPLAGECLSFHLEEKALNDWRVYKPQSVPRSKLLFPKGIEKLDRPELYHIELCHTFGVHFDQVVPQNLLLSVLQQEPQLHTLNTPLQQYD